MRACIGTVRWRRHIYTENWPVSHNWSSEESLTGSQFLYASDQRFVALKSKCICCDKRCPHWVCEHKQEHSTSFIKQKKKSSSVDLPVAVLVQPLNSPTWCPCSSKWKRTGIEGSNFFSQIRATTSSILSSHFTLAPVPRQHDISPLL